jgi:hypothetical protein
LTRLCLLPVSGRGPVAVREKRRPARRHHVQATLNVGVVAAVRAGL